MGYVKRITASLRDAVERAVIDAKGEVGLSDAATVQTLIRWERHALLAQRWLRNEADKLTPADKLRFSEAVAKASAERDKCFTRLGIDRRADASDIWAQVDAMPDDPPRACPPADVPEFTEVETSGGPA